MASLSVYKMKFARLFRGLGVGWGWMSHLPRFAVPCNMHYKGPMVLPGKLLCRPGYTNTAIGRVKGREQRRGFRVQTAEGHSVSSDGSRREMRSRFVDGWMMCGYMRAAGPSLDHPAGERGLVGRTEEMRARGRRS